MPDWSSYAGRLQARLLGYLHRVRLALVESGGRRLLFTASDRDSESSVPRCEIDAYADVPLTHSLRTVVAVLEAMDDLAQRCRVFIDLQPPKTRALATVPIRPVGQVLGGHVLFFDTTRRFDPPQLSELEDLGERLGAELRQIQRATTRANVSLAEGPVPEGAQAATFSVIADPRAVGQARHFAFRTLIGWGVDEATVNNAVLRLSELVINAVIHTNAGSELHLLLDQGVLTATVRDGGSSVVVAPDSVRTDPLVVHGRGLQLVDAFSTRCGSQLDAGGMAVWFVLEPAESELERMGCPARRARSLPGTRVGLPTPFSRACQEGAFPTERRGSTERHARAVRVPTRGCAPGDR